MASKSQNARTKRRKAGKQLNLFDSLATPVMPSVTRNGKKMRVSSGKTRMQCQVARTKATLPIPRKLHQGEQDRENDEENPSNKENSTSHPDEETIKLKLKKTVQGGVEFPSKLDSKTKVILEKLAKEYDRGLRLQPKVSLAEKGVDPKGHFPLRTVEYSGQVEYLDGRNDTVCNFRFCCRPQDRYSVSAFLSCTNCDNMMHGERCFLFGGTQMVYEKNCGWCRPMSELSWDVFQLPIHKSDAEDAEDHEDSETESEGRMSELDHTEGTAMDNDKNQNQIDSQRSASEANQTEGTAMCNPAKQKSIRYVNFFFIDCPDCGEEIKIANHLQLPWKTTYKACKNGVTGDPLREKNSRDELRDHCISRINEGHSIFWEVGRRSDLISDAIKNRDPPTELQGTGFLMSHLIFSRITPFDVDENSCFSDPFERSYQCLITFKALIANRGMEIFRNSFETNFPSKDTTKHRQRWRDKALSIMESITKSVKSLYDRTQKKTDETFLSDAFQEELKRAIEAGINFTDPDPNNFRENVSMVLANRLRDMAIYQHNKDSLV